MAFSVAYGKIVKGAQTVSQIHVAPFGNSGSIFLQDRDAPDSGTIPNSQYFSDPNFTPGNEATDANKIFINGEYGIAQSNWRTKSNGDYRLDWFPRRSFFISTTYTTSHILLSGIYPTITANSNQRNSITGDGLIILGGVERVNLYGFSSIIITGDINNVRQDRAEWVFTDCLAMGDLFSQTNQISGQRHGFTRSIVTGWGTVPQSNNPFASDVIDTIFVNIPKDFQTINGGYIKERIYQLSGATLTAFNYSNLENQSASGTNISANPEFNAVPLGDYTAKLTTPHFLNGGINKTANIGNARFGKTYYKADGTIESGLLWFSNEAVKVVGTVITLTSSITAKDTDTITVSGTTNYNGTYTVNGNQTGTDITIVDSGLTDNGNQTGLVKLAGNRTVSEVTGPAQQGTWTDTGDYMETSINLESDLGSAIFVEGIYLPSAPSVDPSFNHLNKESDGSLKLY